MSQVSRQEQIGLKDAAEMLGVHQNTLRNWADKGLIAHIRLPSGHRRFERAEIDRLREEMEFERGETKKAAA